MSQEIKSLTIKAKGFSKDISLAKDEVKKVIVGQEEILDKLLIALIADGHVLLEGVPGLAKTLMVKTFSDVCGISFCRIQFTPDLLPADIIGTKIYNHSNSSFSTQKGPVFHNFILADEINRAPPKVQSALLEAMQERQVSIHGETFVLDSPFMVLATQNPIETEGTYKLPEAQVDRFALKLIINYPSKKEEAEIIRRTTQSIEASAKKVLDRSRLLQIQRFCREIYADEKIENYVSDIVDATRHPSDYGLDLNGLIEYGASPRASIWLVLSAKARAMIDGRGFVIPEDIKAVAKDVLRHRIILSYEAEAEGMKSDELIDRILSKIKSP